MNTILENKPMDFALPKLLECAIPTEERGIERDEVRLMISERESNQISHAQFKDITNYLEEGDVLIVNTSGTLNAGLEVILPNGKKGRVHLSTQQKSGKWLVELRQIIGTKTKRFRGGQRGEVLDLAGGGQMEILDAFYESNAKSDHLKLWQVTFSLPLSLPIFLEKYGIPIRYTDVDKIYPNSYYQTVFANEWGSAEMPSAGRAFTPKVVTALISKGVQFAPILLHTGVASLEIDERPYPEFFRVSATTANLVNQAKAEGRRIIAVGTTAIRAIESAADQLGKVIPQEGQTNLFITPERGLEIVNGLLTGFHEPRASHLLMLEALVDRGHLVMSYEEAIKEKYQWHEFGDLHLLI